MQRKKILILIPTLQVGGSEKQVFYLARELSRLKYDVTVATFYPGGLFWDRLSQEDLKLVSLNKKGKLDFFSFYKSLVRLIRENNFDVVQTFLPIANFFGLKAAHKAGIKKIFAGIRSSYMDLSKYSLGNRVYFYLSRGIINRYASGVIYNSYAGEKHHKALGFKGRSLIIWNAVDSIDIQKIGKDKSFKRQELGVPVDSMVISVVARFDPMKDFATLINALGIVSKDMPNIYLLILGTGDLNIKRQIMAQAKSRGIEANVKLLGFREDVHEIVGSSDLFICSSRGEGLSNSLLEAMGLGIAAISTDVGDHAVVLSEERGLIVKPGNAKDLARAIKEILLDKDLRQTLARNAYSFTRDNFSLSRMAEFYLKVWGLV